MKLLKSVQRVGHWQLWLKILEKFLHLPSLHCYHFMASECLRLLKKSSAKGSLKMRYKIVWKHDKVCWKGSLYNWEQSVFLITQEEICPGPVFQDWGIMSISEVTMRPEKWEGMMHHYTYTSSFWYRNH